MHGCLSAGAESLCAKALPIVCDVDAHSCLLTDEEGILREQPCNACRAGGCCISQCLVFSVQGTHHQGRRRRQARHSAARRRLLGGRLWGCVRDTASAAGALPQRMRCRRAAGSTAASADPRSTLPCVWAACGRTVQGQSAYKAHPGLHQRLSSRDALDTLLAAGKAAVPQHGWRQANSCSAEGTACCVCLDH